VPHHRQRSRWTSRATVAVAIVCTLLAGTACAVENTIALAPNPRADSLVFLIRDARTGGASSGFTYGLSVLRCGDERAFWTIAADGTRHIPEQIVYGQPVPGFTTRAGPDTLRAGCYKAIVSASTPLEFDVAPTGQIRVRSAKP
jgi:hypothetical protein